jgi:hypothetical protein
LTINNFAILSLIPVFDGIIYPNFHLLCNAKRSLLRRTGVGFVILIFSMLAAAAVEQYRTQMVPDASSFESELENSSPCVNTDDYNPYLYQNATAIPATGSPDVSGYDKPLYCHVGEGPRCEGRTSIIIINDFSYHAYPFDCIDCDGLPQVSRMSVLWQVPQFFLVGVAEILTAISAINFFYEQVPPTMRSVSQSFNLVTMALGMFLGVPILYAVNAGKGNERWLPRDLNHGHLADYFYLLAGFMVLDVVYFYFHARNYVEKSSQYVISVGDQISKQESGFSNGSGHGGTRTRSSSLTGFTDLYDATMMSNQSKHRTSTRNVPGYNQLLATIDDEDRDEVYDLSFSHN